MLKTCLIIICHINLQWDKMLLNIKTLLIYYNKNKIMTLYKNMHLLKEITYKLAL